ncbi:hypothetical protein CK503_01805 [Aliifodinibius salipaludis]|uniref:Uncharacterized protein n=1 Tax=Fodinibius salipaludis TaxID=2032627 RepID=A0A2A2GEM8_9BACT|nr:hypothetical protein [Aliifodinibius salipaludis]PAU95818.1 hypothetical protein CK503_01805 [Aliifodinibius salipaludis]
MEQIRSTYKKSLKGITLALLFLFGLHFLSIHGFVDSLVYCFEEDGQINIESEAGSIFSIPSEDVIHTKDAHQHTTPTLKADLDNHHDVPLSLNCAKEEQTTRFDQERMLKLLDGMLYSMVETLPQSRAFQLISYPPLLIEDTITASLKTVVRILYN